MTVTARRLACVVGTRPQLIKAAAAWPALRAHHRPTLIDTGQHYDEAMAGAFFGELGLPAPGHQLGVGSGTHARQLAAMLDRLEPILLDEPPHAVVVFGDTNSTLAGALVASKLGLPLAHVEAGLRSFDRRMPEEVNRVVVDHLAGLLLAPSAGAAANLRAEGIPAAVDSGWTPRVRVVGDLMQDLCAATVPAARAEASIRAAAPDAIGRLGLRSGRYVFATVHRAENREPAAMRAWTHLLGELGQPVVLALHPGTRQALDDQGSAMPPNVHVVPPQGYRTTLALQLHAAAVVTDSGGVQREAAWLGVPCLVLRETTEWGETLEAAGGRGALVGRDLGRARAAMVRLAPPDRALAGAVARVATLSVPPAGAGEAVAATIGDWLGS